MSNKKNFGKIIAIFIMALVVLVQLHVTEVTDALITLRLQLVYPICCQLISNYL
jgi:fructose-specific phosphotransferase system IIC component